MSRVDPTETRSSQLAALTTPGAALARLAQAPAWPREIIGYARGAEGIPDRGAKYGIVGSTIEYSYDMQVLEIPDRGRAAMR